MSAERVKSTARLGDDVAGRAVAANLLSDGDLVAFGTETVYGLGADAASPTAVAKIYAAKGRPAFNPLIAHVESLTAAHRQGRFDATAAMLAEAFWPGPLTLVVPVVEGSTVCELARAGLTTVALRVPAHPTALALIRAVGRPIAAPSANRSGHVSPVDADHVLSDLGGRIDAVLDSGPAPVGIESTIVACLGGRPRLLRMGGIATSEIETLIGRLDRGEGGPVAAPGMLSSHYAPSAVLRLDAQALEDGEAGLDFGARWGGRALDLSPRGDPIEAAANLYAFLRRLDATAPRRIAIAPVPQSGLGEAINDRLHRAAAPRPC